MSWDAFSNLDPDQVRRETAHAEIARRARELWEQEGRPAGRDEEIWLEAERQLRGINSTESPTPATAESSRGR